jgi:acetone carboxylase gamma subunit
MAVGTGASTEESARREPPLVSAIGDAYVAVGEPGSRRLECARCSHDFGPIEEDPKLAAVVAEKPITASSKLNETGLVEELVQREFYCPGCGALVAANVQRKGDPVLVEMRLAG